MNMVAFAHLTIYDSKAFIITYGFEKFIQSVGNLWFENFSAVLYAPYYMIIDVVYASSCVSIFIYNKKRAFISAINSREFPPNFLKFRSERNTVIRQAGEIIHITNI